MRRYTKGDYFENNRGEYMLIDRKRGWNRNVYYLKVLRHENERMVGKIIQPDSLSNYTRID